MHKICEFCGKEFNARQENQRWCSKECREKANSQNRRKHNSKNCGITHCYNYDTSKTSNCKYFDDARKCKLY